MSRILKISLLALGLLSALGSAAWAGDLSRAALKRIAAEVQRLNETYFQERQASDWAAIYNRQHPAFRRQVPIIQFVNLEGRVAFNPETAPPAHISGASLEPEDQKTKLYQKRDLLGFPTTRPYHIFPNPWITIRDHRVTAVAVSRDGRRARVVTEYDLREQLDPSIFRVIQVIDHKETLTDYWEKVNGRWVVPLMKNKLSLSGHKMVYYFTPHELPEWERGEFAVFPPVRLTEVRR